MKQSHFCRILLVALICSPIVPMPLVGNALANDNALGKAHVLRRLNSPERAAVIAKMARLDAAAGEAQAQSEAAASARTAPFVPDSHNALVQNGVERSDAFRPQSVTEALFNYAAGFAGVPGLAPRPGLNRGVDGSLDEGLGFHQDGTARKAGGVVGSSGPSANGQRARAYMQSGLQSGYGMNGYAPGLYGELHYDLWGRDDSTRGGRISSSSGYSRELSDFDPMSMALDRGLNYGTSLLNSAGEAALSGLVDGGRARLNFRLDRDGYLNGEGDAVLPFYDSAHTTIYAQLGARSMHSSDDTRWIGNFGLGQRWFPLAQGGDLKSADYDAGMLMLGYNAFFDYDLTRDHQRGGFGAEVWYDWLRLSSNYYFPLSDWKNSKDFDSRFVKERPAEGWDARVKAYMPFYRHVAVTGAYSQWYGDHVGMFGASKLEKDPKVWSYGVEYTPVPLVSGFITQKSTERGRTDTEFGLNFTYHFQMPWEDQISHSKVTELRTVGGSRHEFVDRENRIILEYKAKNSYRIEYLGQVGSNVFKFHIVDGFGTCRAGQTVRVSASGVTLAATPAPEQSFLARVGGAIADFFSVSSAYAADFSQIYTTGSCGEFLVSVSSQTSGPVTLTVQAGGSTQSFPVNVTESGGGTGYSIAFDRSFYSPQFSGVASNAKARQSVVVTVLNNADNTPVSGASVSFSATMTTTNQAVLTSRKVQFYGLTVNSLSGDASFPVSSDTTATNGQVKLALEDIVGERTLALTASVTLPDDSTATAQATITFGDGPLAVFRLLDGSSGDMPSAQWVNASPISTATSLPAAALCGNSPTGFTSWSKGDYSTQTGLPTITELNSVSSRVGNGAWDAAGWTHDAYWAGELRDASFAFFVRVNRGSLGFAGLVNSFRVVCRR